MSELLEDSPTELARRIKTRELNSEAVVEAFIRQADRVNPAINAMIHPLFDEAREAARKADQALAASKDPSALPPFHGVPCTIKGAFAVKGAPWVVGNWYRRETIATKDAIAVTRYRQAGMIPIGITNVPEALTWIETSNKVHGLTRNPHRLNRTPGGSSGGEAAMLASGATPVGLGTDFGGSIRIPSAFCGVAGHKPTGGLTPGEGTWPLPVGELAHYACAGPMARKVADLFPLLKILAGGHGLVGLRDPSTIDLTRLRVFFYLDNGESRSCRSIRSAVSDAADELAKHGCAVQEWRPELLSKGAMLWMAMVGSVEGGESFAEILGNGTSIPVLREMLLAVAGRSHHTIPTLALAGMEKILKNRKSWLHERVSEAKALQAEIEAKLGDDGILLAPIYPTPAPFHHFPKITPFGWVYSGIYNVLEFPATAIPRGTTQSGLPLAIQAIAARGGDSLTLAAGLALEKPIGPKLSP